MRIVGGASRKKIEIGKTYAAQNSGAKVRIGAGPERVSAAVIVAISKEARDRFEAMELERFTRSHQERREHLEQELREHRPDSL